MNALGAALAGLGVLASLVWIHMLVIVVQDRRRLRHLVDGSAEEPDGGWPDLSVIFAARDEAGQVETAVRSLLAQDYPDLKIVAVDDRSSDGTGEILDRLAAADPRLRVIHIGQLPPGWLGKTHALQVGARAVPSAGWILFTDGDVAFSPGALRKATRFALDLGADHVTLAPECPVESIGERLFMTLFSLLFLLNSPQRRLENPRSRAYLGVGAFNLVRADAFRSVGGFERLALSVDDDMRLGQALKWNGFRTRFLMGHGAVKVRWQAGLGAMIAGLEKNYFGWLTYRPDLAALALLVTFWLAAAPHVGLLAGPWWTRSLCAAGVGSIALILAHRPRISGPLYAVFLPVSAVLHNLALARSVWKTYRQRGVRWRGHLYPLGELRTHVRRRDAWLRSTWRRTRRGWAGAGETG